MLPPAPPTFSMMTGWPSVGLHLVRHDARDRVGRAARRERNDQCDLDATERSAPARHRLVSVANATAAINFRIVSLPGFLLASLRPHLMPAALMIGHHFSISAFWNLPSAAGEDISGPNSSCPMSSSRLRVAGSASAFTGRVVELGNDILRRALRHPEGVPEEEAESRQSCLVGGRHIRHHRRALVRGHGKRFDQAASHVAAGGRCSVHHEVDIAGEQILHGWTGAAIWHEGNLRRRWCSGRTRRPHDQGCRCRHCQRKPSLDWL